MRGSQDCVVLLNEGREERVEHMRGFQKVELWITSLIS